MASAANISSLTTTWQSDSPPHVGSSRTSSKTSTDMQRQREHANSSIHAGRFVESCGEPSA
eukprot:6723288-Prymnesium_polylepis.1